MNKKTDAEQNAENWAETILSLYKAYVALNEGAECATAEGDEYTSVDEISSCVLESALSVEVRGDWYVPYNTEGAKPTEYRILLSWGGPALQITGGLNNYCEPDKNPQLQCQDWFAPWTNYTPDVATDEDWENALIWFISCFSFGE